MKRADEISPDDVACFLAWIDADPDRAAESYVKFQRKLTIYFAGRARGTDAEDLAAEVLRRTLKRFSGGATLEAVEPGMYIFGVARNVLYEEFEKPAITEVAVNLRASAQLDETDEECCLKSCLTRLSKEERDLLLEYHGGEREGERKQLRREIASDLHVGQGTLRKRVYDLKNKQRRSVEDCLQAERGGGSNRSAKADHTHMDESAST